MVKTSHIGSLEYFSQKMSSVSFFWNIKNNTTVCKIPEMLLGYQELIFGIVAKPIDIVKLKMM